MRIFRANFDSFWADSFCHNASVRLKSTLLSANLSNDNQCIQDASLFLVSNAM